MYWRTKNPVEAVTLKDPKRFTSYGKNSAGVLFEDPPNW